MTRLLPRLQAAGLDERSCLSAFMELTLQVKNAEMGEYLRAQFKPETFENYYREKLKPFRKMEKSLYLNRATVKEYLTMGYDLQTLCRLVMTDPEGNQISPEDWMRELLTMKLHQPEKNTEDYTKAPGEQQETPQVDSVHWMLTRLFWRMHGGVNRNVDPHGHIYQSSPCA
jgi:hypothetical protein